MNPTSNYLSHILLASSHKLGSMSIRRLLSPALLRLAPTLRPHPRTVARFPSARRLAVVPPHAGQSSRGGGFSYPGPRKLSEIVKLPLLAKHSAARVRQIWSEYHTSHASALADTLNPDQFAHLIQRTARCPHFVLPVPRGSGFFTLFVQFQGPHCFLTYLDDYKKDPNTAVPYLTLSFFDDFLHTKGLVLMRADVVNVLNIQEAKALTDLIKLFYMGSQRNFDKVVAFNRNSTAFDFRSVLKIAGIAS